MNDNQTDPYTEACEALEQRFARPDDPDCTTIQLAVISSFRAGVQAALLPQRETEAAADKLCAVTPVYILPSPAIPEHPDDDNVKALLGPDDLATAKALTLATVKRQCFWAGVQTARDHAPDCYINGQFSVTIKP